MQPSCRRVLAWIGAGMGVAAVLAFLYPDGSSQDAGTHYLFARWAWVHPEFFVGVWSRPAFTFLYAFPALLGYPAAKLFTVLVCGACAWQTWKVAEALGLSRPWLAAPLLFFQPSFLLLSGETMTEPLFALLLVSAVRLHYAGRVRAGMVLASTLMLARPEGFVVAALWAAWVLQDRRDFRPWARRILLPAWLAAGPAAWWLAALIISGDPLYIPRNWPEGFATLRVIYGSGPPWGYAVRLPEVVGPLFIIPFVIGTALAIRNGARAIAALMLSVLLMHSILWWTGTFGTAGYPRYLVTVSPLIALLSLVGWNAVAGRMASRRSRVALCTGVILVSAVTSILYVDGWSASRDAWAVDEAHGAFRSDPRPVRRVVWSQAYMAIRFDVDPWSSPAWGDRERNLRIVEELPSQTLVFWDVLIGPGSYHLTDADFERQGFARLYSKAHDLIPRLGPRTGWFGIDGPRRQEMHLLYRP